ncbi:hypothetical protein CAS74_004536 [Pichia kudriavzevii]|uniref:HTH La-type RNA-binding domain-containing protein n=1 Tax=Pichia kudriavzevii TaxID=4909 RepID=A0A1Z8JI86_PICKU|nr:hypothetical protein CAS74_004536 [Pichia kudriavzevii]
MSATTSSYAKAALNQQDPSISDSPAPSAPAPALLLLKIQRLSTAELAPAPLPLTNAWGKPTQQTTPSVDLEAILDSKLHSQSGPSSLSVTSPTGKWVPFKGATITISDSSTYSNKRKPRKSKKKSNPTDSKKSGNHIHNNNSNNAANNRKSAKTNSEKRDSFPSVSLNQTSENVEDMGNVNENPDTLLVDGQTNDQPKSHGETKTENGANNILTMSTTTIKPKDIITTKGIVPSNVIMVTLIIMLITRTITTPTTTTIATIITTKTITKDMAISNYRNYNNYNRHYTNHGGNIMNWIADSRIHAVASVAAQLNYYFDISNLLKDIYLRKHMNSQGWIDLTFVSQFYRVRAFSCGDLSVIRDALDQSLHFEWGYLESKEDASDETNLTNPIQKIKVRAIKNPLNWVLSETEREGCGLDELCPTVIQAKSEPKINEESGVNKNTPTQEQTESNTESNNDKI